MAAWQVDFYLVPRAAIGAAATALTPGELIARTGGVLPRFRRTISGGWTPSRVAAIVDRTARDVGPRGRQSHRRRFRRWPRTERDHPRDVRRLDSKFGAALIEFVRKFGALLVRRDGLIVEPTIAAYAGALRSSNAWRFANDPAAFLARARRRKRTTTRRRS